MKAQSDNNPWKLLAAVLAAAFIVSLICGNRQRANRNVEKFTIKTDTVFVRETIRIDRPLLVEKKIIDSILVPVIIRDTIERPDTIFITLGREQRHYREPTYEAWVSGYDPALDSLHIYSKIPQITTTIERYKKSSRFFIGFQAGYGIGYINDTFGFGPYVGVGIGWRF